MYSEIPFVFTVFSKLLSLTAIVSSFLSYTKGTPLMGNISLVSSWCLGITSVLAMFFGGIIGGIDFLGIILAILCYRLGRKQNYKRTRTPHPSKKIG